MHVTVGLETTEALNPTFHFSRNNGNLKIIVATHLVIVKTKEYLQPCGEIWHSDQLQRLELSVLLSPPTWPVNHLVKSYLLAKADSSKVMSNTWAEKVSA